MSTVLKSKVLVSNVVPDVAVYVCRYVFSMWSSSRSSEACLVCTASGMRNCARLWVSASLRMSVETCTLALKQVSGSLNIQTFCK